MARFSEEERKTIWDMREAGVPVKRIAKRVGRLDGPGAVEPSGSGPEQGGEHRFGVGEIWKEEVRAEATE
jgi:hypothetical protein